MTPQRPDRPLRKTLIRLRTMSMADRQAILELLDPAARARVERALGENLKHKRQGARAPAGVVPAGHSEWLNVRLTAVTLEQGFMTATAIDMLRACAQGPVNRAERLAPSPRPTAGGRLATMFRSESRGT